MTRVVLIDDRDDVRAGIARSLSREEDIDIVGEASCGHDGIALVGALQPHVVIVDGQMPDIDGPEVTQMLLERWPHIKVVGYSADEAMHARLRDAGAAGCLLKPAAAHLLVAAVRSCMSPA